MKETPLSGKHRALGARMIEFAGYLMPVSYTSIQEEHQNVRSDVGVFDVSHMGEFIVRGKEAETLLQKVTSNNVSRLEIGQAQYSCLPNNEGGIVDDLLVYRLPEDQCAEGEKAFMLVVNASNIEKDWNWISGNNSFDAKLINISGDTGLLAVQGPNAEKALQSLTDIKLDEIEYYSFVKGEFGGIGNVLISATGYTGSGGFELYVAVDKLEGLWDAVFEAGKEWNIQPTGLGARDTLRLEMGYCLYGNDIDDTTSPLEAGLGWITKTKKGDFNSRDIFLRQREEGLQRKLVGFVMQDRRVPRHGYSISDAAGNSIGEVTSGTLSPTLGKPIGMGYVPLAFSQEGQTIYVDTGKKLLEGTVKRPPFVDLK